MKLFYSIISKEGQPQSDFMFSLGGFCSSSAVSSSQLNSLFGDISETTIERNEPQYLCLILKNILNYTVSGATLWFDGTQETQGKFRVALSDSLNGEFESVSNIYSKPLYAEFEEVDGESSAIILPTMIPEKQYALWIERSINTTLEEIKKRTDSDYLYSKSEGDTETIEKVSLKIKWDSGVNPPEEIPISFDVEGSEELITVDFPEENITINLSESE